MEIKQALSLSLFLVETELEENPVPTWKQELKEAKKTLRQELSKYQKPAGRFFTSVNERPKALNSRKQNVIKT